MNHLINSLEKSLFQTKNALADRLEYQTKLQNLPETSEEELNQVGEEILALKYYIFETETAIKSLLVRSQTSGFDQFGLGSETIEFKDKG